MRKPGADLLDVESGGPFGDSVSANDYNSNHINNHNHNHNHNSSTSKKNKFSNNNTHNHSSSNGHGHSSDHNADPFVDEEAIMAAINKMARDEDDDEDEEEDDEDQQRLLQPRPELIGLSIEDASPKKNTIGANTPIDKTPTAAGTQYSWLAWLNMIILPFQASFAVILQRYTLVHENERHYFAPTVVIMGEVFKLIMSVAMMWYYGEFAEAFSDKAAIVKISFPAVTFLAQNNLRYVALRNIKAVTFQVLFQLRVLTTAVLWALVFRSRLGWKKWTSLMLLLLGIMIIRWAESNEDQPKAAGVTALIVANATTSTAVATPSAFTGLQSQNAFVGIVATLGVAGLAAVAGVSFEWLIKGSDCRMSFWQTNLWLSGYSIVLGFAGLILIPQHRATIMQDGFFHGYTWVTHFNAFTQGFGGLIVGLLVKHADVIMKDISMTMGVILSAICSSIFLEEEINAWFWMGTIVTLMGALFFSWAPRPEA